MHVHDDPDVESAELAARLAGGDRDALAEMYRRWSTLVHTIALRSLGDPHDAEDVVQQVFVAAWQGRASLRLDRGSPAAWLVGITKHRVADAQAGRYRSRRNLQAVASAAATEADVDDSDWAERLLLVHELERMGDPRAAVLRMAFIEDRTHDDIARTLELPLGTVKSHVRRGLIELRNRLQEVERVASER
ncbi:sigma-70 family RNA polymerase sigma factor [Terrabacter sp. NPDC000476]|uniref:RNA polymerase sigma factor n=1 Tax=Terrabacter sp. NPDC000476 TaxID=3154258 RepID=UPI003323DF2B